jgi:hypothetical protein
MISHLPAQAAPDYWSDIDFAASLETEIIQEELRGDILVTRLRYTSHKYNGQTIRVSVNNRTSNSSAFSISLAFNKWRFQS